MSEKEAYTLGENATNKCKETNEETNVSPENIESQAVRCRWYVKMQW